jgi:hypothetical protein
VFLLNFVKVTQYPSTFQKICYGAHCIFLGCPKRGIARSLNILFYEHEYNMH